MRNTWLGFVLFSGCLGGQVVNGSFTPIDLPQTVTVQTCRGTFATTTAQGGQGYFWFNPFDEGSSALDDTLLVPQGMVVVTIGSSSYRYMHQFDQRCTVPYDNDPEASVPCSRNLFVQGRPAANAPLVGPAGEAVRYPAAVDSCRTFDSACKQLQTRQLALMWQAFTQHCLSQQLAAGAP